MYFKCFANISVFNSYKNSMLYVLLESLVTHEETEPKEG